MEEKLDYIVNSFTKTEDNVNLEVDNLNVGCITSKNNNFELDQDGNVTVKTLKIGGLDKSILDLVYPVNSIYMSVGSSSPSMLFGGTWERIKDTFLLAAGNTYTANSTGGEASHELTINEIPPHNHRVNFLNYPITSNKGSNTSYIDERTVNFNMSDTTSNSVLVAQNVGGGQSHNNMPPYLVVNVWKRTA